MKNETFYSNGKLLISGEYLVLDGTISLALPTKYGQSLIIEPIGEPNIIWKSYDEKGHIWFENIFELKTNGMLKQVQHDDVANKIIQILNSAKQLNPDFLNTNNGFKVSTSLTFPKNWGLGTSSTLINNIANWADVDAYVLLEKTFGGSGYDIACAQNNYPILYQLKNGKPTIKEAEFNPTFKEYLYFVYLNKKQNSRDGIEQYKKNKNEIKSSIKRINHITAEMISCKSLEEFERLIIEHEDIISKIIKQKTIQELLFNDFEGQIKSLGAWGGDFILATSKSDPTDYFIKKGFGTVIAYDDMILKNNL